jgi:hypothetical protein
MKKWITFHTVCFVTFALLQTAAGQADAQKENAQAQREALRRIRTVGEIEGKFYDQQKIATASKTLAGAQQLADEIRGIIAAHEGMIRACLLSKPSNEIAVELIRGLQDIRLSPDTMRVLCDYLGVVDPASGKIAPRTVEDEKVKQAIKWLDDHQKFSQFPAFETLLNQGESALPLLREFLTTKKALDSTFDNAVYLLMEIGGKDALLKWSQSAESGLTGGKKSRIRELMK